VSVGDRIMRIRNAAPYAGFVEYGTRKIKPRYFTRDSMDEIAQKFKDKLSDLVEAKLNRRNTRPTRDLAASVAKLRGFKSVKEQPYRKL